MQVEAVNGTPLKWRVRKADGSAYGLWQDGHHVDTFETEAQAKAVMAEALQYARFLVVRDWMVSIGCCRTCSTLMAFARVEREGKREPYDWRAARGECGSPARCGVCLLCGIGRGECQAPESCADRANRLISDLPKP